MPVAQQQTLKGGFANGVEGGWGFQELLRFGLAVNAIIGTDIHRQVADPSRWLRRPRESIVWTSSTGLQKSRGEADDRFVSPNPKPETLL